MRPLALVRLAGGLPGGRPAGAPEGTVLHLLSCSSPGAAGIQAVLFCKQRLQGHSLLLHTQSFVGTVLSTSSCALCCIQPAATSSRLSAALR